MKTRSSKATSFVSVFSAFMLIVLLGVGNNLHAQTLVSTQTTSTTQAALKYLGTQEDAMYFHVQFRNDAGSKFRLAIYDAQGEELYNVVFNDKAFDKKFQLPKAFKDKIVFTISEPGGKQLHLFEVNTKVAEEVSVRRL